MQEGLCTHWNADNYTDNLQGRLIYKDECCKCFGTPKDEEGLDVCLRCFVGSCSKKGHSEIHFKNSEHPLVVKIFKTPKKLDGEAVKVTKLAIGKPGGIDPETDKFDVSVKVYCYSCNKYLDHTLPQVASLVDSILLAQSAYDQSKV